VLGAHVADLRAARHAAELEVAQAAAVDRPLGATAARAVVEVAGDVAVVELEAREDERSVAAEEEDARAVAAVDLEVP
jgi:hypothetical protein